MKTDSKKGGFKVASQEQHQNLKNTRRTLKVLQQAASDKENLAGRPKLDNNLKLISDLEKGLKCKTFADKFVQTDGYKITAEDLTSEEASEDYWRILAEKRGEQLNESLQENERLKENIEALQEENRVCKEMLEESKALVDVLQINLKLILKIDTTRFCAYLGVSQSSIRLLKCHTALPGPIPESIIILNY